MEFDQEQDDDHDEEMELDASYDSLGNSASRVRMPSEEPEGLPTQSTTQPRQQQRKPRYRECLKNHAVGIGGHALDGCGEFMPAGADNTIDALKCAACNCHRNFHRKETYPVGSGARPVGHGEPYSVVPPHHYPTQPQFSPYCRTPAGYLHLAPNHRPLALPSTSGGRGSDSQEREVKEDVSNPSGGGGGVSGLVSGSKKRHRTKFTNEQKEKMLGLAERVGWKIQKEDETVVQQFCNETGIKRHVLKVWLHNNKHTLGKNKPEG